MIAEKKRLADGFTAGSIATFGAEIDRINAVGFEFQRSSSGTEEEASAQDEGDALGFVRAAYSLQIFASQLRPAAAPATATIVGSGAGESSVTVTVVRDTRILCAIFY